MQRKIFGKAADSVPVEASCRTVQAAWLAKYTPVEQAVLKARARRLDNAARRREKQSRAFGDLCEATEGLAVAWRRDQTPWLEQIAWADGDVWTLQCLMRYRRLLGTRCIDRLRHQVKRPLYYAAENARRRALAAARRRVDTRMTENARPTREAILDAWTHRRDSHAAAIHFGGLLEDLECYLDNALRFDEHGNIVGRNGGIKRWLQEEIPALYLCYTTVMRYKAAARKLRQATGLADPMSATRIVAPDLADAAGSEAVQEAAQPGTDASRRSGAKARSGSEHQAAARADVPLALVRARAIWGEVRAGLAPNATALMARLDALLDPARVEEATMLASWRTHYENEITLRTKNTWWRRLGKKRGAGDRPCMHNAWAAASCG